jgi:N-acetylglucosaminyldiphosphoundecaprenol N-acetyl-beta-D-mannosaminyltransferase
LNSTNSEKINITGIMVNRTDINGAARMVASFVEERRDGWLRNPDNDGSSCGCALPAAIVCTPNAEIMMEAQRDRQLFDILNAADLVVADGAGVVLASKILGYKSLRRTPGFDLVKKLLTETDDYPYSFFLFGGKPGVAEAAAAMLAESAPGIKIAGCRNGYFNEDDEPEIIAEINRSGADILLAALGAPKQEKWMYCHRNALNTAVCIGVGGSLDVFAGTASLAPDFFRRSGLEWLYRLFKEPWRFGRMMRLPKYILFTIYWRIFKQRKIADIFNS